MGNNRLIFKDIPVKLDMESIRPILLKKASPRTVKMYEKYVPLVEQVAKPKAIVKWADAQVLDEKTVKVEEQLFESVLLADKLKGQKKIIAIVVTAGSELKDTDLIESEAVKDTFSGIVLSIGSEFVMNYLTQNFDLGDGGLLQPGSLPDWPIINNHKLMEIIGGVDEIGVSLNDSGYMLPWNSLSGIYFLEEGGYKNCTLCTKLDCIGRRAEFNKEEYERIFGKK